MTTLANRITATPQICGGQPTIRGTRLTANTVLEHLAAGEEVETLLKAYPQLEKEDVQACLQFAATALASRHYLPLIAS